MDQNHKKIILVVDDTPDNLSLMSELLRDDYTIRLANSGERALKLAHYEQAPDLILLDIMMPEMDGYQVCRRLKADKATKDIPVVFLTAKTQADDEKLGLELGAIDYISKPISPSIFQIRIKNHLELKDARDALKNKNQYLESEVERRTSEITTIQEVTIKAMASLAETRDTDTGNHIRRTQHYIKALAEKLRNHPRFSHFLDDDNNIDLLYKSAPLHDIGKVGIPDKILLKPGKLDADEFKIMMTHTTLGRDAIQQAENEIGRKMPFLSLAKQIAYSHQEKWNGTGYPEGLSADDIPISARLMAIADVYDALISRRVYKEGMPHEKALEIITSERNSHFDPDIVDAFLEISETFREIAKRYSDTDDDLQKKHDQMKKLS